MNKIEVPERVMNNWLNDRYIESKAEQIIKSNETVFLTSEYAFCHFVVLHKNIFVMDCRAIKPDEFSTEDMKTVNAFRIRFPVKKNGKKFLGELVLTVDTDKNNHVYYGWAVDKECEWIKEISPSIDKDKLFKKTFNTCMVMFSDIQNWSMNYKKKIIKLSSDKSRMANKVEKSSKDSNSDRKIIMKSGIVYTHTYEDVRSYTRHIESWDVKGHYRHYKNGKTVYIKPYQKGEGEINEKKYVIPV